MFSNLLVGDFLFYHANQHISVSIQSGFNHFHFHFLEWTVHSNQSSSYFQKICYSFQGLRAIHGAQQEVVVPSARRSALEGVGGGG